MRFVWTIDIEVLEASNFGQDSGVCCVLVKQVFGVSVCIEGSELSECIRGLIGIAHAVCSIAIGSGAGCINESAIVVQGPESESFGELEVIVGQIGGIGFRRS